MCIRDSYGSLHDKLAQLGAKLLCSALELIFAGTAEYIPQSGEPTYADVYKRQVTGELCD